MWFFIVATCAAVFAFTREDIPLEVTSLCLLMALLVFGQLFPLNSLQGQNLLSPQSILIGFANPSLIAVLALLVMGQGMIQTNALSAVTNFFMTDNPRKAWYSIAGILIFVGSFSAFLNNTPLVILTIPLIQALAKSVGISQSRYMMPLSYVAILGGMTTLIGSSTNLLIADSMEELGVEPFGFFDFVIPGLFVFGVGLIYCLFVLPFLLPNRAHLARELAGSDQEFVAELDIVEGSKLIGMECVEGKFPELKNIDIKLIQRSGFLILPPFEGYRIEQGDILIISATRDTLTELLSNYPGFLLSEEDEAFMDDQQRVDEAAPKDDSMHAETRVLAEVMITPASRLVDMSLDHAGFGRLHRAIVLGIQRRAKVVRRRLGRIRLEAGDVLLVAGRRSSIDQLRSSKDFIVLSGSKRDLPPQGKAPVATALFAGVVLSAAFGILSIPVAALAGSVLMILTGCLNVRQAGRAIDRKIFLLVGSMLALGTGLEVTGGAGYVASQILQLPFVNSPLTMIAVLFALVSLLTNFLTNNAAAILFTPIAINMSGDIMIAGLSAHETSYIFALTVLFASNCSFASPIGYQTNLLVMGPGHYRFKDFILAGLPLTILVWFVFMLLVHYYFGVDF